MEDFLNQLLAGMLSELSEGDHCRCPCSFCRGEERTETGDLGAKAAASILLADRTRGRIVVPSREEWIGLNLLERDDELPNRRR